MTIGYRVLDSTAIEGGKNVTAPLHGQDRERSAHTLSRGHEEFPRKVGPQVEP